MTKYVGKQDFRLGSFPEVGQKQQMQKERDKKEEKKSVITMVSTCRLNQKNVTILLAFYTTSNTLILTSTRMMQNQTGLEWDDVT